MSNRVTSGGTQVSGFATVRGEHSRGVGNGDWYSGNPGHHYRIAVDVGVETTPVCSMSRLRKRVERKTASANA